MDAEYEAVLPATDSRVRSDRRHLEHEDLDTAAAEKHRLEEKQRADRREREAKHEHWTPRYFQALYSSIHMYPSLTHLLHFRK